jgi:hypothetical protein
MSPVRMNAEKDATYRPYCMRCRGLVRMAIVEPFYWRCACGAEHDERAKAPVRCITGMRIEDRRCPYIGVVPSPNGNGGWLAYAHPFCRIPICYAEAMMTGDRCAL